jgi:hypothetical protein
VVNLNVNSNINKNIRAKNQHYNLIKKTFFMTKNFNILFTLLLTLFSFSMPVLALNKVTASIDKNPAVVNESIVLTVVADDDVNSNALDTSALIQNFIVGRTSVRSQTSMVNFDTTRTTIWSTVLIARKAGIFTIPAFSIENKRTQPITLTVLAANDPIAQKQKNIFINSKISSAEIYVQQQVILSVKLYFSAELRRGNLSEPTLKGANVSQVGTDKESDEIVNGKRYRVIERVYAISPQKSGNFVISAPRFSGEIMMPSSRRSNFLSFGETKPVSIIGDDINLTVRPIPVTYQGHWLPSEIISLHQEWQPALNNNSNNFIVGEPITRTITLTAAGLSKEQLPKLNMTVPPGLKVYPDQVELHSSMPQNRLVSQAVRSFAIVASQSGTFELPEIVIPWWNTVTNRQEKAVIAAQTITISPNPNQQQTPIMGNTSSKEQLTAPVCPERSSDSSNTIAEIVIQNSWVQWLYLALWLTTALAWFISTQINKATTVKHTESQPINDHYLALLAACKQQQGKKALSLIVPWVNSLFSTHTINRVKSLDEAIKAVNDPDFGLALAHLQQTLYGKSTSSSDSAWKNDRLIKAIQKLNKQGLEHSKEKGFSINP